MLVTSSTSHHSTKEATGLVTVSLADSTDDCTEIHTGNDTSLGSKKVPTTPSLQHNDRILTWNAHRLRQHCWKSQHVLATKSILGTYSCSLGKSVIVTDLGKFFSQLTATEHLIKGCELHLFGKQN